MLNLTDMKKRRKYDRELKQMVVDEFADNNVCFKAIFISHPKFSLEIWDGMSNYLK